MRIVMMLLLCCCAIGYSQESADPAENPPVATGDTGGDNNNS